MMSADFDAFGGSGGADAAAAEIDDEEFLDGPGDRDHRDGILDLTLNPSSATAVGGGGGDVVGLDLPIFGGGPGDGYANDDPTSASAATSFTAAAIAPAAISDDGGYDLMDLFGPKSPVVVAAAAVAPPSECDDPLDLFGSPSTVADDVAVKDVAENVNVVDVDPPGEDMLDMEGWNRRRAVDEDEDDVVDVYGVDKNAPAMDANAEGAPNDVGGGSRRLGLFGGWRGGNRGGGGGGGGTTTTSTTSKTTTTPKDAAAVASTTSTSSSSHPWSSRDGARSSEVSPPGGVDGAAPVVVGVDNDDVDVPDDDVVEEGEEHRSDNRLRPGDHVYVWQSYGINPRAYQRHAVVFSVDRRRRDDGGGDDGICDRVADDAPPSFDLDSLYANADDDDGGGGGIDVTVVSFYHFFRHHRATGAERARQAASGDGRGRRSGCRRESLLDFVGEDGVARKRPVHKVRYGRAVRRGLLSSRAGVGTALKKDQPGLVLARLRYLLENPDHLPDHSALSANGECASLWCVTGRWCTLQGASILAVTSVGQAGGALLAGGIISNLTVLVPMPGLWGMAGWWWSVPATVAYPFLVPMLVTMGMASLVPLEILRRNRKRWKGITDGLNHEFWTTTSDVVREEYFGMMATAEREAEMRSFFGVREGDASAADDARYMPVGGAPGGPDGDDDEDEEAEALAMQRMEKSCRDMAADINVDLSGKPPPSSRAGSSRGGAWGSFVGSFRKKESGNVRPDDTLTETERFNAAY